MDINGDYEYRQTGMYECDAVGCMRRFRLDERGAAWTTLNIADDAGQRTCHFCCTDHMIEFAKTVRFEVMLLSQQMSLLQF